MQRLERATVPYESGANAAAELHKQWKNGDPTVRGVLSILPLDGKSEAEQKAILHKYICDVIVGKEIVFKNDLYQVHVREVSKEMWHISIRRLDRECCHDWRDLQEIKNQIVGKECEAIEIYPAESRRIDTANQYHLWAFVDPNYRVPIGWSQGRHVTDTSVCGSVNRPLEKV